MNEDTLMEIISHLSFHDMIQLCRTNRALSQTCKTINIEKDIRLIRHKDEVIYPIPFLAVDIKNIIDELDLIKPPVGNTIDDIDIVTSLHIRYSTLREVYILAIYFQVDGYHIIYTFHNVNEVYYFIHRLYDILL